ncbi:MULTISPECIES: MerR family transcriptional regulator [unclassified Streptococcus]|uniref:MerR family transcriptional regulator n=1 Tax=unclassified Streptococcus TaxID=2608887 RepID=UPI0011B35F8D|nr:MULTISPECIES: MerR family transcriptional regulator [unclassified Streptococcus]TWS94851.1 MerR family transcriptional regulator [Streptococcus sp. sy018]TWT11271.1 MerR family transcriptional regulator [Streptococcus sp. sy004]TWT16255.1 MerR family transcriptional regulator [Streptococcus sp. sy010]
MTKTNEHIKLNQIEQLLNYLITLIQTQQQELKSNGLVTQKELLKILNISPNTLKSWENTGLRRLEPPIENTRTVYYKMEDVINYLTP